MLKPKFPRHFVLLSGFALVASSIAVDVPAQSHMRSWSAEDARADRFEERFIISLFAKIAWTVEKLAPSLHLRLSYDKEKVISTFFENYHVKAVETNLFASEQYQKWARVVLGAYEDSAKAYMALFHELKKHFDDYELAAFVHDGLTSLKAEAAAREYSELQIKDWVANKEALDVFRALKLDADKGNVFKNPLLETYVSFARRLPREYVSNEQPIYDELYSMLEQKFGVVRLAEMLGAPNVDLQEGSIGGRVMNALFRDVSLILPKDSLKSVESVFNKYAVVDSSALSIWLSYAKWALIDVDYEELVIGIINGLWNQREVKVKALATVIAAAQKDASTREVALNTLDELFVEWENEKKTTSDVLNILGLELAVMKAEDMTESPLLETWFAFESRRHDDDAALLEELQSQLTDEQLASILVMKTRYPKMADRLYRVRKALFEKWHEEFLNANRIFQRLRLHEAGDKLFTHPALSVWFSYVLAHHRPRSGALITQVVKKHYRDTESLLDMVNRELKINKKSSAKSIAYTLMQNGISS